MLNVPVNNFSVMSGWSNRFLGITSTFQGVNVSFAQGHNSAEVGIDPAPLSLRTQETLPLGYHVPLEMDSQTAYIYNIYMEYILSSF